MTVNSTGQSAGVDGAKVQMSGTSPQTLTTSPSGIFSVVDIPLGFYNFTISKEGYPSLYINNFDVSSTSSTPFNVVLYYAPSATNVTNFSVTSSNGYASLTGKLVPSLLSGINEFSVVVYMSTSANVSWSNYVANYLISNNTDSTFTGGINLYDYFPSGSTVYLIAYTTYAASSSYAYYTQPAGYNSPKNGKIVYNGLNTQASNVVSVKLP